MHTLLCPNSQGAVWKISTLSHARPGSARHLHQVTSGGFSPNFSPIWELLSWFRGFSPHHDNWWNSACFESLTLGQVIFCCLEASFQVSLSSPPFLPGYWWCSLFQPQHFRLPPPRFHVRHTPASLGSETSEGKVQNFGSQQKSIGSNLVSRSRRLPPREYILIRRCILHMICNWRIPFELSRSRSSTQNGKC